MPPQYQIWVQDNAYAKKAIILRYASLEYTQRLNGMGYATLAMHPDDSKIAQLTLARRLLIIRNGVVVFGGRLLREGWAKPETAPAGETWTVHAVDGAHYAKRRIVVPAAGQEYDTRTDHADDVAKDYVYYHAGAGAAAARQLSDLAVAADAHGAASITENARYDNLFELLVSLREKGGAFDWRFVPSATGVTFTTAFPQWGLDRTKGNGVNDEFVMSVDRRTFSEIGYTKDAIEHDNYLYVAGQGEGADRTVVERSTAGDITTWGRCEALVDARNLSVTASLEAHGDAELLARKPVESMDGQPIWDSWKRATAPTWDLGDLVTIYAREWGRSFTMDAKVAAVTVSLTGNGLETVTPELEAV